MWNILWVLFAILLLGWIVGLLLEIGGTLIYLLLVAALVVLVINLVSRAAT
jgi:hypothetical protein